MISKDNILALKENTIVYIVGARLSNLSNELIEQINKSIIREDGKSIRMKTDNGYLICSYSSVRYRKDKYEMEKQIDKAKLVIDNPFKNKNSSLQNQADKILRSTKSLLIKPKSCLASKGIIPIWKKTLWIIKQSLNAITNSTK